MIAADVQLGRDVIIPHPELVNLYGCAIGDGCKIASFVEIQREARLGRNVKVEAFAFIPSGVAIEDGAFIGPHVCFTNDRYPAAVGDDGDLLSNEGWSLVTTHIGQRASIGANATVICGVTIGEGAMVAAGSVVTHDVPPRTLAMGVPARVVGVRQVGSDGLSADSVEQGMAADNASASGGRAHAGSSAVTHAWHETKATDGFNGGLESGKTQSAIRRTAPWPSRSDPSLNRLDWDSKTVQQQQDLRPIRVGVIGYGYWGPNLVRNFAEYPGSEVCRVADKREDRLAAVRRRYPEIATTTEPWHLLNDPKIDAIAVCTPISTHFDLALAALQAGKHVFVEKAMTATSDQGERLVAEANRLGRVLMVDHTFVYTGAVQKIKEIITEGRLGRVCYYDSVRINLGLFQHDVDVLWDLAVHDLSIMEYVLGEKPVAVAATGISHVPGKPINTGYLTCFFNSNLMAHVHANWLAPVKIRRTLIGGDAQMIVYDDLEPSDKLKVYDRGVTVDSTSDAAYELMVGYRVGDMWAPQVSLTEALRVETQHFVECIRSGSRPITDGDAGLRVVRILEAASESVKRRGLPIEIVWRSPAPHSSVSGE